MRTNRWCGAGVFALWGLCAGAAENRVLNPGFEQTEAPGKIMGWSERKPAYTFVEGAGRDGSRGLAFENRDPKFYSFPTQKLELEPGCCYAFEVWVKAEGLKGEESGATVCMEWSGPDGKWLGGAYAEGVRDTAGGWQKVRGVTRALPTNAVRVTVAPYVRRGMTGKVSPGTLKPATHGQFKTSHFSCVIDTMIPGQLSTSVLPVARSLSL